MNITSPSYERFKTPFYEIRVGDSSGQRMVKLPHHIVRLVKNVEIVETFEEGAFNTITIDFIEGSREPASPDAELGTAGLYKIPREDGGGADLDIAGSITNRIGTVADLRFSGNSGITFTTASEQRQAAIDTTQQKNVEGDIVTRSYPREPSRPVFLFQERNQLEVRFGYIEDPATVKTVRSYIQMVSVKYPENGQVQTTIVAQDTGAALDQITVSKGVPFGRSVSTGVGENSIVEIEDEDLRTVIRNICDTSGTRCVISDNLPVPSLDTEKQKIWLGGESFYQFMWRLARSQNALFKVVPDKDTGQDTLYFVKKSDFEKDILVGGNLLNFKQPGSILKSVEIKVDFAGLTGDTQAGVTKEGQRPRVNSKTPGENAVLFKGRDGSSEDVLVDRDAASSTNPIGMAKGLQDNLVGEELTGNLEINPDNSVGNRDKTADIEEDRNSRIVHATFISMGFTRLAPGTVEISGLGVRYSGRYRILTTRHNLSAEGYVTECKCEGATLAAGGQINPTAVRGVNAEPPDEEEVTLFKRDTDRAGAAAGDSSSANNEVSNGLKRLRE